MHSNTLITTSEAIDLMLSCSADEITNNLIDGVQCNATFVCEADTEKRRLDFRRDTMGVWLEGNRTTKVPYRNTEKVGDAAANTFVWRLTFTCKSYPFLKKAEIFRRKRCSDGSVGALISPFIISYRYTGSPKKVVVQPHGNSKSNRPFHPSTRTLLGELKESITTQQNLMPTQIYNKVKCIHILY